MRSMVRRVTSSAPEIDDILTETENTPFTRRITRTKVPMNNKLRLPVYDGIEDPMVFLRAFNVKVARADFGKATEDQGKCQLFVESLRGEAQAWFTKLPRDSIGSFEDLRTTFINQYMMFREEPLKPIDLTSTRQNPKETLHDFIKRFKDIYAKIRISDDLAIDSLIQGLPQGSSLRFDLTSRRPHSMVDAFYRAHVHIKMEEANVRPPPHADIPRKVKEPTPDIKTDLRQPGDRLSKNQRRNIFSVSKSRAFKRPWNNTYRRNQAPHEEAGLENPDGRVPEERTPTTTGNQRAGTELGGHPNSYRHRVNMILEEPLATRKRTRMEVLKVSEAWEKPEIREFVQPHISFAGDERPTSAECRANLLTIQVFIAGYRVRGALVDTGSTVNVINVLTLAEMRTNISRVNFQAKRLVPFGGCPFNSIGSILLPVAIFGSPRHYQFEVVDQPTGYSVVLGVPWLHATRAIVSVHHQCLKIPVPGGYFPVRSDQITQHLIPSSQKARKDPRTTQESDPESEGENEEFDSDVPGSDREEAGGCD